MPVESALYNDIVATVESSHHTFEFGSGVSTFAFQHSKAHTAIEQDGDQATALERFGVHYVALNSGFYEFDWKPVHEIDVMLIDGPWRGDRSFAFGYAMTLTRVGSIVYIDDIHRDVEMKLFVDMLKTNMFQNERMEKRWGKLRRLR